MDGTPQNRNLMLLIITGVSIVILILFGLLFTILSNRGEKGSEEQNAQTEATQSITPAQAITVRPPQTNVTLEPVNNQDDTYVINQLPLPFEAEIQPDVDATVLDNSNEDFNMFDVKLETDNNAFTIIVSTVEQAVELDELSLQPNRFFAPYYQYEPDDFEVLTTINGAELVVSRTGAADLEEVNGVGIIKALPVITHRGVDTAAVTNEYYVYQKYNVDGKDYLSEYMTVFSDTDFETPTYMNHVIIRYHVSDPDEINKWEQFRVQLEEFVATMKPSGDS